jgi:exoribonuclease R
MVRETAVQLRLDSRSLFEALIRQLGEWRLDQHEYQVDSDEVRMSYDAGGSGRVAVTIGFELDRDGMERLLREAQPID